jgi:hypothetical protein
MGATVPRQGLVESADVFSRWAKYDRTGLGRVTSYWADAIKDDPYLRDVVMVVELVFGGAQGGRVLRVATQPVSQVAADGKRFDAIAGLVEEPEIVHEYTLGVGASSVRAFAMTLDARYVSPAELILSGLVLDGFAEVSLQQLGPNRSYEDRLVIMRGDLASGVRFGAVRSASPNRAEQAEILDVEVADPKESLTTKLPPWVADSQRFLTLPEEYTGDRVPLVINGFDRIPALRITSLSTGVNDFIFTKGDSAQWSVSGSDGVYVNGVAKSSADATYAWALGTETDALNDIHARIRFTNAATMWADTDSVHVVASRADADKLTVVSVIEDVLERHSGFAGDGVNHALFGEADARFGSPLKPSVLVNASSGSNATSVIGWIEDGFLKSFPMISMVWRDGKYGPVVTDFRNAPLARWEAGKAPLLDRFTLIQSKPKEELFNEFVLRYDYDSIDDVFRKVKLVGASNSSLCRYARQLGGGERHAEPIESKYIVEDGLAQYVLDWMSAHMALPSHYIEYESMTRVYLEQRRGDSVLLTEPEFGWIEEPATIERLTLRRGRVVVGLRVWVRYVDLGPGALGVTPLASS